MPSPQTLLARLFANPAPAAEELGRLTAADWSAVIDLAQSLWLTPLLYRQVIQACPGAPVPAEAAGRLRSAYYQTQAFNAHLLRELSGVLAAFQQAAIPAVVLKGAALAHLVYRDPGLRPMADLDLLLPEADLARAARLLQPLGFVPLNKYWPELDLSDAKHLPPFIKDNQFVLELHWSLTRPAIPAQIDLAAAWARCRPVVLDGLPALALSPEDDLLYLCVHASYNHKFYQQLRSLCDIHEWINFHTPGLDWPVFVQRVEAGNAARGVYLALRLTRDLLGASLPGGLLERIQPGDCSAQIIAFAQARLFQTEPVLSANFLQMMDGQTGAGRLGGFFKAMLPAPAVMSQIYQIQPGSWRVYLHYPLHWGGRIARYWKTWTRLVRGDKKLAAGAEAQQALSAWLNH